MWLVSQYISGFDFHIMFVLVSEDDPAHQKCLQGVRIQ